MLNIVTLLKILKSTQETSSNLSKILLKSAKQQQRQKKKKIGQSKAIKNIKKMLSNADPASNNFNSSDVDSRITNF